MVAEKELPIFQMSSFKWKKIVFQTQNLYLNYCWVLHICIIFTFVSSTFCQVYHQYLHKMPFCLRCWGCSQEQADTHRILSNSNLSSQTALLLQTFIKTMLKMFKFLLLLCLLSSVEGRGGRGRRGGSLLICIGDPLPLWLWLYDYHLGASLLSFSSLL